MSDLKTSHPPHDAESADTARTPSWSARDVLTLSLTSLILFAPIFVLIYRPIGHGLDVIGYPIGRDFINFWAAPQIAFGEGGAALFDLDRYNELIGRLFGAELPWHMWSYPPVLALFLWPLSQLPYFVALAVWALGSFAILACIVASATPTDRRWLAIIALTFAPATLFNAVGGQNGFITASLFLGAMLTLDRRPLCAGVMLGLLTFKPHLGLIFPVVLIALGAWRTIAAASVTTLVVYVASLAILGVEFWERYVNFLANTQLSVLYDPAQFWSAMMMSPMAGVMALGGSATLAGVIQIVISTAVVTTTAVSARSCADPILRTLVVASAAPLVSHQVFTYDMVLFAGAWILVMLNGKYDAREERPIIVLAWLAPSAVFYAHFFGGAGLVQMVMLFAFVASIRLVHRHSETSSVSASDGMPLMCRDTSTA